MEPEEKEGQPEGQKETIPQEPEKKEVKASFQDREGREWHPLISIPVLRKACRIGGITLADLMEMQVNVDAMFLLLWLSCEKEAKERRMTVDDFEEAIGLENLGKAFVAFSAAFSKALPESEGGEENPLTQTVKAIFTRRR